MLAAARRCRLWRRPAAACCPRNKRRSSASSAGIEYPNDPQLRARIKSYELAFGMQTAVPQALDLTGGEAESTRRLYGLDQSTTEPFGKLCLAARRLVERGVRFVQVFHGGG